jgi:hypothetical protein
MLTFAGCIHRFEPVDTEVSPAHRWTKDLYVGDVVRLRLLDGRRLEGEVRWFNASGLKVEDEVVSLADVQSLEKRRINPLGVAVVGLTVVAVVVAVLGYHAAAEGWEHLD